MQVRVKYYRNYKILTKTSSRGVTVGVIRHKVAKKCAEIALKRFSSYPKTL